MTDEYLHHAARECAGSLRAADRKQLRFNDIIATAKEFYPIDVEGGVKELVLSCDRQADAGPDFIGPMPPNPLYVRGSPMWQQLRDHHDWMTSAQGI